MELFAVSAVWASKHNGGVCAGVSCSKEKTMAASGLQRRRQDKGVDRETRNPGFGNFDRSGNGLFGRC